MPEPLQPRDAAALTRRILDETEKLIYGKREVLEQILAVFIAGGHILLEDYPGLAKTLIANSFAQTLGMSFKRIQFTPDLLPGDITGGYLFNRAENQFVLRQGPVFTNVLLADEINRASPRTQSALLEAMQEQQVTLEGETAHLPQPFIVIATQNPIEYEGTFPLPEAQLDRFMVKLSIGYPDAEVEREILSRRMERRMDTFNLEAVSDAEGLLRLRATAENVHLQSDLENYIVTIVQKTRAHRQIAVGASPRGSLALMKLARAWAVLQGRNYVLPDDIKLFVLPALHHRLILHPDLWTSAKAADNILSDLILSTPVPVITQQG